MMENRQIIMNFTVPPSPEDISVMAATILEALPEELYTFCEELTIRIDEFPDEATEQELELGDSYDLLALYKSGREISPGVERKTASEDDLLILYRRPIMDMWCENCEDLNFLLRQVIIEELGRYFDFSEDEIYEMTERHYQGLF